MIQGQFNCIITCKTAAEAFRVEGLLNEKGIDTWVLNYKGSDYVYTVYDLNNREYESVRNFLILVSK